MDIGKYIGDGVYVSCDGYHIWLKTSDGRSVTNEIALDPHALRAFMNYLDNLVKDEEETKG